MMRDYPLLTCLLVGLVPLSSCDTAEPERAEMFGSVQMALSGPAALGGAIDGSELESRVIALIDSAETSVAAAFADLTSEDVATALVNAQSRGLRVRVVADEDRRTQAGFTLLRQNLDGNEAEPSIVFGDGAFVYNPEPAVLIDRPGGHQRMTHNFVLVDGDRMLSFTGGFDDQDDPYRVVFQAVGEDLLKDFTATFNQMHSGTFADFLDTFGGPHASITDNRDFYFTPDGPVEVYFGPQQRLIKRVIDEIYAARGSVYVVTRELRNQFVVDALRYKAEYGFEVAVVVDEDGATVNGSRVGQLRNVFRDVREDTGGDYPALVTVPSIRQTVVIIDAVRPADRSLHRGARAYVLTQPMFESFAVIPTGQDAFESRPSDGFTDAHMWGLRGLPAAPNDNVEQLIRMFEHLFARGQ